VSLQAAVHILPVSNLHNKYEQDVIENLVNGPIIFPWPYIDAIKLLRSFQLFNSVRTRIRFQTQEVLFHAFSDITVEFAKVSLRGGSNLNTI
jgi:hypothetical protein